MIPTGGHIFEVGSNDIPSGVDAEQPVRVDVGPIAWGPPCVTSGKKLAMPLVPVDTPTPVPVRLNRVSMVNVPRSSLAGSPKVT